MKHSLLVLSLLITCCSSPQLAPVSEHEQTITATEPATEPAMLTHDAIASTVANNLEVATRSAIERALPFLEQQGIAWMEGRVPIQDGSPCVSCHHVGYAMWSHAEAQRAGIEAQTPALQTLAKNAIEFLDRPEIPRAMSAAQVMLAEPLQAARLRPGLLELQEAAGSWRATGQFPSQRRPIAESDAIATMVALFVLQHNDDESTDQDPAVFDKALAWLDQQPAGESTEWLASHLMLTHALESEDQASNQRRGLIDRQRPDGGWGWTARAESDAFSTGQALYALSLVATPSSTDGQTAIARAVRYLIESQGEDGTWQTASALVSDEPSEPKDVIYHYWGTAWATLGLARSLPV